MSEFDSASPPNIANDEAFLRAKQKLESNGFSMNLLPINDSHPMWNEIQAEYRLSLPEKAALQAYVRAQNPVHSNGSSASEQNLSIDDNFAVSPYGNLQGCLENIPDVCTEKAVLGPGPCLWDLLKSEYRDKKEELKAKIAALRGQIEALSLPSVASVDPDLLLAVKLYTIKEPIPLYKYFNRAFNSR